MEAIKGLRGAAKASRAGVHGSRQSWHAEDREERDIHGTMEISQRLRYRKSKEGGETVERERKRNCFRLHRGGARCA